MRKWSTSLAWPAWLATRRRRWLALCVAAWAVPWLVLVAAGFWWLWERGWLLPWLIGSAVVMFVCHLVFRWRVGRQPLSVTEVVEPDPRWAPAAQAAWRDVEQIAQRVEGLPWTLERIDPVWDVVREVLAAVARHYHSDARQPELEIPVPYLLRVIELAAADLRRELVENIPGSHILTLGDIRAANALANVSRSVYGWYRVVRLFIDPVTAAFRELSDQVSRSLWNAATEEVKRRCAGYFVRKTGYYAIQLYSGQLVLDDVALTTARSRDSERLAEEAEAWQEHLSAEPLRILVLGQSKAGKSSLINALFGETRAATDVVPRTRQVEPFLLEREGFTRALILDTAGYGEGIDRQPPWESLREEVLRCDLVLLVSSAVSAARAADRQLLDDLRGFFQTALDRKPPPELVVLTHVDRLRPWNEWHPPYDLVRADSPKARQIAEAVRTTAEELAVGWQQVIPVCLRGEPPYNVHEALVPAILQALPEAERVKYLRCLREHHDAEYWQLLGQQACHTGRLLAQGAAAVARELLPGYGPRPR